MTNTEIIGKILKSSIFKDELTAQQINPTVADQDEMSQGGEVHYFETGLSALKNIAAVVTGMGKDRNQIEHVLDFPCGYGRVMRYTKAYFPNAEFYGSEIEQRYLDYCEKTFNTKVFLSKDKFEEINISQKFDVIWVGSLFTHLTSTRFKELYHFLTSLLKVNGVLIFTTHGRYCYGKVQLGSKRRYVIDAGYLLTGYGYCHQHGTNKYGDSLTSPNWLNKFISKETKTRIVYWSEQGWQHWQDVIAITPYPIQ